MLLSIWRWSKSSQGLKHIHFSLPCPASKGSLGKPFRTEAVAAGSFHLTGEDTCQYYYCLDFAATCMQDLNSIDLRVLFNTVFSQWGKGGSLLKTSPVALNQSPDILISFPSDTVALIRSSHWVSSLIFCSAILSRPFCSSFYSGMVLETIDIPTLDNWTYGSESENALAAAVGPFSGRQVGLWPG